MIDLLLILVILAVLALAGGYVYKAKKKGQKCIGCPYSCQCGKTCQCEKDK